MDDDCAFFLKAFFTELPNWVNIVEMLLPIDLVSLEDAIVAMTLLLWWISDAILNVLLLSLITAEDGLVAKWSWPSKKVDVNGVSDSSIKDKVLVSGIKGGVSSRSIILLSDTGNWEYGCLEAVADVGASAAWSISGVYKESSSSSSLLESVDFEEFTKEGGDEDDARSSWILSGISGKCIGVTIGFGFNENERVAQERSVALLLFGWYWSLLSVLLLLSVMREETTQAEIILSIKCLASSGRIWLKADSMSGTAFSMVASISRGITGYVLVSTCCSSFIAELVFDRVKNIMWRSGRGEWDSRNKKKKKERNEKKWNIA